MEEDHSWIQFDLWTALRSSVNRYPSWKSVAQGTYSLLDTIELALGQSRQGPELVDLMEILSEEPASDIFPRRLYETFDSSGQTKGAPLRTLDRRLASRYVALPPDKPFESPPSTVRDCLTDTALGALAAVVYDLEEDQFSKDKIAMQRQRHKKRRSHP